MRSVVVGVMAAAALAWAHGARGNDASSAGQKGGQQQQPGSQSAATAPGHETGVGGTDRTSRELRSDARADQGARANGSERHEPFQGKKNFSVNGRVARASSGEITIDRKDLPAASLHIAPGTKVEVDGKAASAAQLSPGQEVRASFNLRGGTAEAVEVKAKKASRDDQQKLMQQRHQTQQDERKQEQKQNQQQQGR